MTKMGPPGRGKGRAPAVYWVCGELSVAVALTAAGFLIPHDADPRVAPHTQPTRTRKGSHMPRASCYFRAPDDPLMHAHLSRHDSAAQELPGGGRVGCSRRLDRRAWRRPPAKAAVGAVCGGTDRGKGGSRRPRECLRKGQLPRILNQDAARRLAELLGLDLLPEKLGT